MYKRYIKDKEAYIAGGTVERERNRSIYAAKVVPLELKRAYGKAERAFAEGRFDIAVEQYGEAIKADPKCANAYFNRAIANAVLDKYADAEKDISAVLKLEPESHDALYVMAVLSEQKQKYEEAKILYTKSLLRKPGYENALDGLKRVRETLRRSESVPLSVVQ